jgi:uncharacterized membrane protein
MSDTYNSAASFFRNFAIKKKKMKFIFIYLSLVVAAGVLFVNVYTSVVDARSWGADLPRSIETARQYFKNVNPGNFFRVYSPVNQLLALIVLIIFWKVKAVRSFVVMAFVLYLAADAFTFAYFYPRNDIMFVKQLNADAAAKAWKEWNTMNWLRSAIVAAGIVCTAMGLHRYYLAAKQ